MLTLLLFIARAFISGGFQAAYVYTPEVGEVPESGVGTWGCCWPGYQLFLGLGGTCGPSSLPLTSQSFFFSARPIFKLSVRTPEVS